MSGLPGGAVTFLFSDIEGSTRLVKALRDRYAEVLARHRHVVRAAFAAHGGHEVDTQGDAFFAAFGDAKAAVLCALEIQRNLAAHDWPGGMRVRVRIGIHTGQATPAGGAYTGLAVHRAARIAAAARGGQVLISQATQTLIEDEEEGDLGFTLVDLGEYRLKDLDRPVRLFELSAAGLDSQSQGAPGLASRQGGAGGAAGVHGWPAALTSFVGRAAEVEEVAGLLEQFRLVTVTGPGGSGKTRLAGEAGRRVAGLFAEGVWLAELAPVRDPAQVPAVVAVALGIREHPGVPVAEALARVLARQQLLLVLDNCEHVIDAAAALCAGLLLACDDLRVLATSREPLRVAGEARYRLAPMSLPAPDDLTGDVAASEAVALFADRARRAGLQFELDSKTGPAVARLVRRLDGMPLAIELAAARAEALGMAQLLDRIDDRLTLLTAGDRAAAGRQQSLAATVQWSYQLLDDRERRVFRALSVFPGPFTLEGAEAVAGEAAGPAVLRLVDCSLVSPPRAGADGRFRYVLLETLRAYGGGRLAQAGEHESAAAALARYALQTAEQAAAQMQAGAGEAAAARWLDAEDPTMHQVLAWAMDHDAAAAVRLAVALGGWWRLRGRLSGQYPLLLEAARRAEPGSDQWCAAQCWLGWAAVTAADLNRALAHFTAVCDTMQSREPSRVLADALAGRSTTLLNSGRIAEGAQDSRRSLDMARELSYLAGEGRALGMLAIAAMYSGDFGGAVRLTRRQEQLMAGTPGSILLGGSTVMTAALIEAGDLAAAGTVCAAALARCQDLGDLEDQPILLASMADLALRAGRIQDAAAHLRDGLQIAVRTGDWFDVPECLRLCGLLCASTGRHFDAVTLWAAEAARSWNQGVTGTPIEDRRPEEALKKAQQALGPARTQAAQDRGAAMSTATAAEYALILTSPGTQHPHVPTDLDELSARERELVTLVARGRTDAQIAAELNISTRTVRFHLDRIRDKTGYRRRADLARLAVDTGLI